MAAAPSNTPIAAPIAVSSWTTSGDDESLGSTVFLFTIIGRPSTPSRSSSARFSARRLTQMLFALKKRWRPMSSKASWSSSGTCAVSRSTSPPSSRAPRQVAALAVGLGAVHDLGHERQLLAREPGRGCAGRAPRPGCPSSRGTGTRSRARAASSSMPDVASEVYTSPCPGGAHSSDGSASHSTGSRPSAQELRHLALHEVERQALEREVGVALQRRERVVAGREAVHEQQRDPRSVAARAGGAPGGRSRRGRCSRPSPRAATWPSSCPCWCRGRRSA